MFMRRATAKV